MTLDQALLLLVLGATVGLLIAERWRYDLIALCSLLICVLLGLVAPDMAFAGFADPAVITVVAVLLLSHSVAQTGAVSALARTLGSRAQTPIALVFTLCSVAVLLSAFMNNVGALALLMPVAMSLCARHRIPVSQVLMPLSFATLLGGMTTLIGTPPNLLIARFREQATGEAFRMFDFALVGVPVAILGLAWLTLAGWRWLPVRPRSADTESDAGAYTAELSVTAESSFIGRGAAEIAGDGARLIGIVRDDKRVFLPVSRLVVQGADTLLLEADLATLGRLLNDKELGFPDTTSDNLLPLTEAVVTPQSLTLGSSPGTLGLRERWNLQLVAIARHGRRFEGRLDDATFAVGDVLLLAGEPHALRPTLSELGCMVLQDREITVSPARALPPFVVFGLAIAAAASGLLQPAIAFALGALVSFIAGWIRPIDLRRNVDWSVIVLLAAMIPIGGALESTGTAGWLAGGIFAMAGDGGPMLLLALTLAVTMSLTPFLNNPATVVVLAPIVVSLADSAGLSPDAFLIAVALGASCDFLTPFGHHNNALIMGPGGYRFADYPRAGWPLSLLVFISATLLIGFWWGFV